MQKKVSAENGPETISSFWFNSFIAGVNNFWSSVPITPLSPTCGLIERTAIFGLIIPKSLFKTWHKSFNF